MAKKNAEKSRLLLGKNYTTAIMDSYQHGAVISVRHTTGHLAEDGRRRLFSSKRLVWIAVVLVLGVTALASQSPPRRSSDRNRESSLRAAAMVEPVASAMSEPAMSAPSIIPEPAAIPEPPPVPATPQPEKSPKVAPPAIDETQGTYDWQKCKESKDPNCWKTEGKRVDSYWTGFGKAMHNYWKGFGKGVAHYWSKLRGGL